MRVANIRQRYEGVVAVHRLARDAQAAPGILLDPSGKTLERLGAQQAAQYVVRPDGHIGYRSGGTDMLGAERFLSRWLGAVG